MVTGSVRVGGLSVRIFIKTDNAAFRPDPAPEVARILRKVAAEMAGGLSDRKLLDVNGNVVGRVEVT